MAFQATVNVSVTAVDSDTAATATVSGQANLVPTVAQEELDLVLPPASVDVSVPFPPSVVTAKIAAIKAVGTSDLTVKIAIAGTAISVPQGAVLPVYDVTVVLLSSPLGGLVQAVIAG